MLALAKNNMVFHVSSPDPGFKRGFYSLQVRKICADPQILTKFQLLFTTLFRRRARGIRYFLTSTRIFLQARAQIW